MGLGEQEVIDDNGAQPADLADHSWHWSLAAASVAAYNLHPLAFEIEAFNTAEDMIDEPFHPALLTVAEQFEAGLFLLLEDEHRRVVLRLVKSRIAQGGLG